MPKTFSVFRPPLAAGLIALALATAGPARAQPLTAIAPAPQQAGQDAQSPAPPADPAAQALHLADEMKLALGAQDVAVPQEERDRAIALARKALQTRNVPIDHPQLVMVVDRAVRVQRLLVVFAQPGAAWEVLGAVKVSTGRPGQAEHFKTPVGVMINDGSIPGYRAQGTVNQNGIRGIGAKGLRVYDFGWSTTADWRHPGQVAVVRLEMHATDPVYLEPKLGTPDSKACIHIPTKFNIFIDHHGLLDADLAPKAASDPEIAWLFGPDHVQSPLAGDKVVVVDSSEPDAPLSDPQEAQQIEQNWANYMKSTNHS